MVAWNFFKGFPLYLADGLVSSPASPP